MYYNEIVLYINQLNVPDGYGVEIIPIYNAESMASGYNIGMQNAKGKYKIYIHQDVFIINSNILFELLAVFYRDDRIGMVGLAGCKTLLPCGIWWERKSPYEAYVRADCYQDRILNCENTSSSLMIGTMEPFTMIDGIFMATSKDIPWREELSRFPFL